MAFGYSRQVPVSAFGCKFWASTIQCVFWIRNVIYSMCVLILGGRTWMDYLKKNKKKKTGKC